MTVLVSEARDIDIPCCNGFKYKNTFHVVLLSNLCKQETLGRLCNLNPHRPTLVM
jgi:hypothetical protein